MVDVSRVKEHTRITKSGTKTVKGYDRKKRLKKILAGVGATGLVATGLFLNRNRLKNVLNKAKSKVVDVEDLTNKTSLPKLLSPAKERLRNTTPGIRNDVLIVKGSPETKRERLARLFPTKQKQVEEYISKRKVDTGIKGYLTKAKEKLKLADKIEENATTRADLSRADRMRINANGQISRSTKRLRELEKTSPLAKSLEKTDRKLKRTGNTKVKAKGLKKNSLTTKLTRKGIKVAKEEGKKELISRAIDEVIPGGSIVYRTVDDIKSNIKRVERLADSLEKNGDKISGRRKFLEGFIKKTASELKPKEYQKIARGANEASKKLGRKIKTVGNSFDNSPLNRNTETYGWQRIAANDPLDPNAYYRKVPRTKPNLRNAGLIKRGTTRMNRWLRWKSGNTE